MEGASVKDRIRSLQNVSDTSTLTGYIPPSVCSLRGRAAKAATRGPQTLMPTAVRATTFAEAGARLSFQNRPVENEQHLPSVTHRSSTMPLPGMAQEPVVLGAVRTISSPKKSNSPPKRRLAPTAPQRSTSSGALEAAAFAAQRPRETAKQPSHLTPSPPKPRNERRVTSQDKPVPLVRSGSTPGSGLAAAKASVNGQTPPPKPMRRQNKSPLSTPTKQSAQSANSAAKASFQNGSNLQAPAFLDVNDTRGMAAASTAMSDAFAAIELSSSPERMASPQPSITAAQNVSLKLKAPVRSMTQADKEARFGLVLSRSVSPSPERKTSPSTNA